MAAKKVKGKEGQKNGFYYPKKNNKNGFKDRSKSKDPMAVTWAEKYAEPMEFIWVKIPNYVKPILVFFAILIFGGALRGEWIVIAVHFLKHLGYYNLTEVVDVPEEASESFSLKSIHLENVGVFMVAANVVAGTIYLGIGGFLHWYYYVRQRDNSEDWKCQPHKFLDPGLELHEIITGYFSLILTSMFSGILACYITNGGYSTIYYAFDEYSWAWWFLQWPVIFIYQDYTTYWLHRIYHTPFLYKHFHKVHHKYKQPTAFSVTAIHPFEIFHIQLSMVLPIFVIPLHWAAFYGVALYTYYHGIIDHSGINFKSFWWQPWQPDAIFHDNHHQYFHVNFGFNIYIWDKLHGTYRKKDRIYKEDIFYGKGKSIKEASIAEIKEDINERLSENPLAYRNNKMEFMLTKEDLKK